MSIREALNRHNPLTSVIAVVISLIAIGVAYWIATGGSVARESHLCWYTDDDGKTWFADDADKVTPFDHNGRQAVMCMVYTCDGGKTKFVLYLTRVTDEGKKRILDVARQRGREPKNMILGPRPMEVKKPGAPESEWTSSNDAKSQKIMDLRCPDGSRTNIALVDPND